MTDPQPEAGARPGPDLSPWDPELAARVQPVLSALFHDMMGPLTLIKNRLYLLRRQLVQLESSHPGADASRRVAALQALIDGLDDAVNRIHRGLTIPRDAVWQALLEGDAFDPAAVIHGIEVAMKGAEQALAAEA
jgi:hypothetical protein